MNKKRFPLGKSSPCCSRLDRACPCGHLPVSRSPSERSNSRSKEYGRILTVSWSRTSWKSSDALQAARSRALLVWTPQRQCATSRSRGAYDPSGAPIKLHFRRWEPGDVEDRDTGLDRYEQREAVCIRRLHEL